MPSGFFDEFAKLAVGTGMYRQTPSHFGTASSRSDPFAAAMKRPDPFAAAAKGSDVALAPRSVSRTANSRAAGYFEMPDFSPQAKSRRVGVANAGAEMRAKVRAARRAARAGKLTPNAAPLSKTQKFLQNARSAGQQLSKSRIARGAGLAMAGGAGLYGASKLKQWLSSKKDQRG